MSLSFKLFLLFGFILILAIGGSIVVITNIVSQRVRNQIELRGVSLALYLSSQAAEAYLQDDDLTLVSITAGLKRSNPGVLSVVVVNDKDIIISHSDSILLRGKKFFSGDMRLYKTIFDTLTGVTVNLYENHKGIVVVSPMIDRIRKQVMGKVFLTLSKRDITETTKNIFLVLISTAIITIGIGLIGTML
ncbi:MAG: hypothetical protein ABIL42_05080, partial [candidate division WOR-3 bacterium]